MILQEIVEKVKTEMERGRLIHGNWKDICQRQQVEDILEEVREWVEASVLKDVHGDHGEIKELIQVISVSCKRIMFLTGEDI